ncbi:MAG: hypothetical protein L0387_46070 [Acidobacteria bacterium]|nr:hypothetical protein [Acidobacteriota bacterium]
MLASLGQWLLQRMHPWAGALVAFRDGELGPLATKWVERHVRVCSSCQQEIRRLGEDLSRFKLLAQSGPDPEMLGQGLADLREAMRGIVTGASHQPRAADDDFVAKQCFVAELEAYLGKHAAGVLLGRLGDDDRLNAMLSVSLPALTALLGRKTADAIVARTFSIERSGSGAAW